MGVWIIIILALIILSIGEFFDSKCLYCGKREKGISRELGWIEGYHGKESCLECKSKKNRIK